MKLIDKDALVVEIERMLHETVNNTDGSPYYGGRAGAFTAILSFIDTLETKEEILDEEGKTKLMKKCVHRAYKRGYDMGVLKTINEMNHNIKEVDLEKEIIIGTLERAVKIDAGGYPYINCDIEFYDYDKDIPLAKEGDKVKVVLVKGE